MPTKSKPSPNETTAAVDAFFAKLEHPLRDDIQAARAVILGAVAGVSDGIKWNAPSFRTSEWFATTHLRSRERVQFVFHCGAKVRARPAAPQLDDPAGLVKWLAEDRCLVTLPAGALAPATRAHLAAIVRRWVTFL